MIIVFVAGFVGVCLGAVIVLISMSLRNVYEEKKEQRYRVLEHYVK